jgi:hypothetical protein
MPCSRTGPASFYPFSSEADRADGERKLFSGLQFFLLSLPILQPPNIRHQFISYQLMLRQAGVAAAAVIIAAGEEEVGYFFVAVVVEVLLNAGYVFLQNSCEPWSRHWAAEANDIGIRVSASDDADKLHVGAAKRYRILFAIVLAEADGYHIGRVAFKVPLDAIVAHVHLVEYLGHVGFYITAAVDNADSGYLAQYPLTVQCA